MDQPSDLALAVLEGTGSPRFEPILAISWGEVRVSFAVEEAPVLLIGQAVQLGFRGAGIDGVARVRGFVSQRVDDVGRRTYSFQLEHGDGTALDATVNRRASPRVTPDPAAPIRVVLRESEDGQSVSTLLRDLSEGGLSVLVGREQEWLLAHLDELRIELRLPGESELLSLPARVRHRRLARTAIHYGMSFEDAPGLEAAHEAIRSYVAERRRVMRARLEGGAAA